MSFSCGNGLPWKYATEVVLVIWGTNFDLTLIIFCSLLERGREEHNAAQQVRGDEDSLNAGHRAPFPPGFGDLHSSGRTSSCTRTENQKTWCISECRTQKKRKNIGEQDTLLLTCVIASGRKQGKPFIPQLHFLILAVN